MLGKTAASETGWGRGEGVCVAAAVKAIRGGVIYHSKTFITVTA